MRKVLPILFNTEMVRAILDDKKNTTRRLIKGNIVLCSDMEHEVTFLPHKPRKERGREIKSIKYFTLESFAEHEAPYQPGDILYVRETWRCWRAHRYEATADIGFLAGGDGVQIEFANGNTDSINRYDYDNFVRKWYSYNGEWRPSIHMPKEVARIWIKVKDVRAERLQDITPEGIIAEGIDIKFPQPKPEYISLAYTEMRLKPSMINQFSEIWNSTVKKSDVNLYGWDANPWTWVIEFERCDKPEEGRWERINCQMN